MKLIDGWVKKEVSNVDVDKVKACCSTMRVFLDKKSYPYMPDANNSGKTYMWQYLEDRSRIQIYYCPFCGEKIE